MDQRAKHDRSSWKHPSGLSANPGPYCLKVIQGGIRRQNDQLHIELYSSGVLCLRQQSP